MAASALTLMPPRPDPRRRLILASGLALAAAGVRAAGSQRPIEIGVIPYLPTAQLIAGHQPLRQFIENTFQRQAVLSTAPDFSTFHRRTLAGDYDIVVTGPPLAWHAHQEGRMVWVAVADRPLRIVFLAAAKGGASRLGDLGGKVVTTLAPMSITAQVTAATLAEHGLRPERDVQLRHERTPFNAAQSVLLGDAAAAALPDLTLPALPAEIRDGLRTIHESGELPGVAFLARRAPDLPDVATIRDALLRFARATPQGRKFMREFGHDGLRAPDLKAMHALDRFLPELKRQMAAP